MTDKEHVLDEIRAVFGQNLYPGDDFLQGSFEGSEPFEDIAPFKGKTDWQKIDPELLDRHYSALSSFSQAGLRFFLPAFLIADLREALQTADPVFTLTHGFRDIAIKHQTKSGLFIRRTGKNSFVNPRRYGAMTFYDYARWRLSVFTGEEAQVIVAYLRYKGDTDPYDLRREDIQAALDLFWLDRAEHAPLAESLVQHLKEEAEYLAAIL